MAAYDGSWLQKTTPTNPYPTGGSRICASYFLWTCYLCEDKRPKLASSTLDKQYPDFSFVPLGFEGVTSLRMGHVAQHKPSGFAPASVL